MLRPSMISTAVLAALLLVSGISDAGPPKDKPDPDRRILIVHKDGEKIGELSYKWVRTASGNEFASSKAELKTNGARYVVRTHLKRRADGTVEKYKKWIGMEGAKPDVIAFWKGDKIRTVSKIPDQRFTRTYEPPAGFYVMDDLGFHLYRDLVRSWRKDGDGPRPVLQINDGKFGSVDVKGLGTAEVTRKEKARAVDVVSVVFEDQQTLIYMDEKDEIWGIIAPGLTLTRGGWNLGDVKAPEPTPIPEVPEGTEPTDPDLAPIAEPQDSPEAVVPDKLPPAPESDPKPKPLPID